jgi:hypothetical protein
MVSQLSLRKPYLKDGLCNDFGSKDVVSLQTLVIAVDLAEGVVQKLLKAPIGR